MNKREDPLVICTLIIDSQFSNPPDPESVVSIFTYDLKFKLVISWEGTKIHQPERKQRRIPKSITPFR